VGPPWGHKPCRQICSSVGSSLPGATGPAKTLVQHRLPTGPQRSLDIYLLECGFLHGLQAEICSTLDLCRLKGHSLPHRGLHHNLQVKTLCSSAWSTSFSPYSLTLVSTEWFLSHILALLSRCNFFFLLNYVILEVLPLSLMGLTVPRNGSVLKPAGIGSFGHGGSFLQLLREATPVAPPLTKP